MSWFRRKQDALSPHPEFRELLFADTPLENVSAYAQGASENTLPWSFFATAAAKAKAGNQSGAKDDLRLILEMQNLESRVYLQAWYALRRLGEKPPDDIARQVKGMIIEIGFKKGLDTLAAYSDHSARYINQGGNIIIWDSPEPAITSLINDLLETGEEIVRHTQPLAGPRFSPPTRGNAHINILTYGGIHNGQGPLKALSKDPLGRLAIERGTALMQALIAKIESMPKS